MGQKLKFEILIKSELFDSQLIIFFAKRKNGNVLFFPKLWHFLISR